MSGPERGSAYGLMSWLRDGVAIFRAAFRVRRDPAPLVRLMAAGTVRYLRGQKVPLGGRAVVEVGTGGGAIAEALASAGANVVGVDLEDHRLAPMARTSFTRGRAESLPFADGAFDGAVTSNVLEHVTDGAAMIGELARVVRPGGFLYLSWTTWLSPLGGHEMSPFHYLGPRAGLRAYRAVRRHDPPWNVPGRTLFVRHSKDVLTLIRDRGDLELVDMAPRYWPALRVVRYVPLLGDTLMWNCVLLLRKAPGAGAAGSARASRGGTRPG